MSPIYSDPMPEFSFGTFIDEPGNKKALSACRNVVVMLGHACNPLFICGRSGSGKTHLLHAIGNAALESNPEMKVGYIHAERFYEGVALTYRKKAFAGFRSSLRELDLILLDDVQLLKDKPRSQEELASLIEALVRDNKQVVIASDVRPDALEGFSERLMRRLASGVSVHIAPPGSLPLNRSIREGQTAISEEDIAAGTAQAKDVFSGAKRNPDRIPKLLETIHRVWMQEGSDLRLGQLLVNLASEHGVSNDLFYVEDDQLMCWLLESQRQEV